jgi:hypothetical protein
MQGLPTPKARDAKGPDARREDLGHIVTLLKTPTSNLGTNGGSQHPDLRKAGGHGPNLQDEIEHLLPTSVAKDSGRSPEGHLAMRALKEGGSRTQITSLEVLARAVIVQPSLLLPTPKASDGEHGGPNSRGSKGDLTLPSAAAQLLPTPRATDSGTAGRRAGEGFRPPLSQVVLPLWEQEAEPDTEGSRPPATAGAPTCRPSAGGRA